MRIASVVVVAGVASVSMSYAAIACETTLRQPRPLSQEPVLAGVRESLCDDQLRGGGIRAGVSIVNLSFNPTNLIIPINATVRWTQNDVFTHTVASDPGVTPAFASDNLTTIGQTFEQFFSVTGVVPYSCTLHFGMEASITVRRPGDADGNNTIDLDDFTVLTANFGFNGRTYPEGDFNLDAAVNLDDFTVLAANFGQPAQALVARASAVPEPTCAITTLAALMLGWRRRVRRLLGCC